MPDVHARSFDLMFEFPCGKLYANHDRATCEAHAGNANYAVYYNATEGLCFPTAGGKHSKLAKMLGATAVEMDGLKFSVTLSGINVIVCTAGASGPCTRCSTWHHERATAFGECDQTHSFTVDMIDWLPSPSPGRVLQRVCPREKTVLACPEHYSMEDSVCETRCHSTMLCTDHRLQCGKAVHRPSSQELHQYHSTNGTCSGEPTRSVYANYTHSGVSIDGTALQTMWCGEQCATWKTLRSKFPLCDAPDAKTKYAVNLDAVLGSRCSRGHTSFGRWVDPTPPGECCHAALGFGHPSFPFGTPCSEVCHSFGRVGHDDEWCQISSLENYGQCFCGPERWAGA